MFSSIQEAINDIQYGKLVIVVDDENRENEGDFITAASNITPEMVNFLITEGRGLLCVALTTERAKKLDLQPMVVRNTDSLSTNFTASVDFKSSETSTGISAFDRAATILAIQNENSHPADFTRPGHLFPLIAKDGGVIQRQGHTEAAVDLTRLADKGDVGVLIEIMNSDGTMARVDDLVKIAQKFDFKLITIVDLKYFREINNC